MKGPRCAGHRVCWSLAFDLLGFASCDPIFTVTARPEMNPRHQIIRTAFIPSMLALLAGASCAKPSPTVTSESSSVAKLEQVATIQAEPFRMFDAAAEQELRAAFGGTDSERNAAQQKYAKRRWRFRAVTESIWAAERNSFHMLTVTLRPAGCQSVFCRMRNEQEKRRVVQGETYLVEATVEHFPGDQPGVFRDAVVISEQAENPTELGRGIWRYSDAPKIFPGQTVTQGSFRQQGNRWQEERFGEASREWQEETRTPDYIELSRPNREFFVRLYRDRSEYRYGNETQWTPMFAGKWD
jgi:hypothetical protein